MSNPWSEVGRIRSSARAVKMINLLVFVLPCLSLAGFATGLPILARLVPGGPVMVPGVAVALLLTAAGLWLLVPQPASVTRRRAGQALGLLVTFYGASVLVEYATGRSLGIDGLLFADEMRAWSAAEVAGRPAPHSAVALVVAGLALFVLDADGRHGHRWARVLAPAGGLVAGVALIGHFYGLAYMSGDSAINAMAYPTAATLVLLSVGLVICRPERTMAQVFLGVGPGGAAVRGLAPTVFVTVLLVGGLLTAVGRQDPPRERAAVTVAAALLLLTLYVTFLRTGTALNQAGRALRDERDLSRTVLHSLREGILTTGADYAVIEVTPRWCEITGFDPQDVIGCRPPYPWWPPEQVDEMALRLTALLAENVDSESEIVILRKDGARVDVLVTVSQSRDDNELRMIIATYRDLSERNRAEAERRRSADQLDHFFEISNDLLCISGPDGYFKRLNPAWEKALGYTVEELTSRPYIDFVHPDDVGRTDVEMADQSTGKATVLFENRYRCRDGSYLNLNWNAIPTTQDGLVYAVARDTTSRRQAEDTRAWLAAIVNGTEDAVIGKSLDGTITSWNPGAERHYGYSAEEAIGQSIRLILPPEQLDEIASTLDRVACGEPVELHNTVRVRKNGTKMHVTVSISPIRDSTGTVTGAASIARDITERMKAEERFQRLVLAAPDAMLIVDEAGAITLVNEQTERLFGYPGAELIGQPVELLIPRRFRAKHAALRHQYHAAPEIRRMGSGQELTGVRRDGSQFPVEISLAPLDTEQGMHVSAAIRDITERREVEKTLALARDEALAAAQLKSQFVAMVSHEIRTPMNGVIGLTNLLLQTPLEPGPRRYAQAIRNSGQALLTIINDILDFSKIEAGKFELVEVDLDLDGLLEDVINVAAEAARAKDLEVLVHYPPALPTALRGDAGRLRQALLNLLGNAVKFTDHGQVQLLAEPATAGVDGGPRITFTVTDTGIGVAAKDLPRLFDAFSQVDAATDRQFGGTGLGLTITRQLVELMGGSLDVESEPGQGSRFSFTIPFRLRPAQETRKRFLDQPSGRKLLVVDDNPTIRHFITQHARAWGISATAAPDGSSALDCLRRSAPHHPFDLAVIDQHMSGMNGVTLIEQINADPAIPPLRTLLLTSGSNHDDELAAATGVDAVTAKPVGPSQLFNCLLELLNPDTAEAGDLGGPLPAGLSGSNRGLILLAEDNAINQMVAVDTLAVLGYQVEVARNGVEAVELAGTGHYRAILMDCQMPRMDGYTATTEIRHRERADEHIPIIAMTAGALAEDKQRCHAAGMDDYLAKPIDPDQLQTALDRWITDAAQPPYAGTR
ncbi:MAG: PAS domain S-box protein [Actinoplanes sp.]